MKFASSRFLIFAIAAILLSPHASAQVVEIPDPNLETAIRDALELPDDVPITQQEMETLAELSAWNSGITDLTGLEHATFLQVASFVRNQIRDITPLSGLIHLRILALEGNPVSDITPVANLINLENLRISGDPPIHDITPLANLTRLKTLKLANQAISDISLLANFTQLVRLRLDENQIDDLSPLANLTLLEELWLNSNAITDIAPLIGLKNLKELYLANNPIYDLSPLLELEGIELDLEIDLTRLDELSAIVEVPDPNLKQALREALQLPEGTPITQQGLLQLRRLKASDISITDLTGLEYAINLDRLDLGGNLIALSHLSLWNNQVEDISPLANLTNLISLTLTRNKVVDLTPLANLPNLQYLYIRRNLATDFSSLQNLNLIEFEYDEICDVPPQLPSPRERIESRTFPSIFQPWDDIIGLDHLTWEQRNVLHDLHWYPRFEHNIDWDLTPAIPTTGFATELAGPLSVTHEIRQRRLSQNPNMIFLGGTGTNVTSGDYDFPLDSDFLLRDLNGQILTKRDGTPLVDFVKPEVQDLIIKRIVAFDRCGFYDGVMFDEFHSHGTGFSGRHHYPYTDEEMILAYTNILREIRKQVREDFLIIVNANYTKPTRFAEFINGTMMETRKTYPGGYSRAWLMTLEDTLSWNEQHLREPRINCLQGEGIGIEPPDSPNNLRWMRLFTTFSLTHSDGYVIYTAGYRDFSEELPGKAHLWHDFWDADLGRPVGPKRQLHKNIDGLFIREFTNGWAVYNRSRKTQEISLPTLASPVSDRQSNDASLTHLLPDLDGEIYLKIPNLADVNRDGKVNILDLLQVANSLGQSTPDPNGDGVVNILDLVFVVQQFSQ